MNNKVNAWINNHVFDLLKISIGIVYVWFGALKFFPKLSPADQLAKDTIDLITFGLLSSNVTILLLALWETILGFFLILSKWNKAIYFMLILHLLCTFVPLFCFADISFTSPPFVFTLVGQYIVKNIIIVCAALVLNANSKGTNRKTIVA
ncbi:MAG TPA: doxx family protein [Chryseolinea sp.]|nr:doxx family protein [Chryseolinea sp.]HPH45940.1 doxx family protein [Chryseolinea sp.]HPM32115.1 doxx family protein [Chryseolinea sp.]